ncbi:MAG: helix-turn-helix domain-containing protein [Candidatus Enterenecus sp.]
MKEYGMVINHLDELIQRRGISKNKLAQRAELQRTQLNKYCRNEVTRFDADVLARLCTVLECGIGDLLEFVPPSSGETQN